MASNGRTGSIPVRGTLTPSGSVRKEFLFFSRYKAGRAALRLSCVACFEQLACVFASCGAEIDLHSNLSNRRADWYGLQASRRPYASPAPVTPNNNAPFFSLKINHLQTLRAPQKRHAHCVFCCMTTTYVAQSGTACGEYEGRMLRLAAAGSSAKGLSSRRPVLSQTFPMIEPYIGTC